MLRLGKEARYYSMRFDKSGAIVEKLSALVTKAEG